MITCLLEHGPLPGSNLTDIGHIAVDTESNTVTTTPNHFSRWAVLAGVWRIYLPMVTMACR